MLTPPALPTASRAISWFLTVALPLALASSLASSLACSGDGLQPKPAARAEPDSLYWTLEVDQHAVTLSTTSPYDTLTLTATPRNYRGEALAGFPASRYTSANPDRVLVSSQGKMTAVAPTGSEPILVFATLTANNLKHEDTVWVRVVDDPSPRVLGSLSIHPIPPDSAKMAMNAPPAGTSGYFLDKLVHAVDATGAPLDGLLVSFRSSDPLTASVQIIDRSESRGGVWLNAQRVGTVTLYASATVFGVTKADTLPFRVGWPIVTQIKAEPMATGSLVNRFMQPAVRVGTGAVVFWGSQTAAATTDVVFADTTDIAPLTAFAAVDPDPLVTRGGLSQDDIGAFCFFLDFIFKTGCANRGNFVLSVPDPSLSLVNHYMAARVFPVPGTYEYHSTTSGTSGRVIVVDER